MPSDLKELYKTVWEIKQRTVLDMAAARGIYIDKSQSLNIHVVDAMTCCSCSVSLRFSTISVV